MVSELERVLPETLITDLVNKSDFQILENKLEYFRMSPDNFINSKDVFYKQKCLDFFIEKYPFISHIFKFPNEPMIFTTDYRTQSNTINIGLSICYLESLLLDSNIVLTK